MQKTLAATAIAALVGVTGAASAADMYPSGGFKEAPSVVYPTWIGYYVGASIGGAWNTTDVTDVTNYPATVSFNNDTSGFIGGGQIGYNYQLGHVVMGPEVDLGGISLSRTVNEVGGTGAVSSLSSGFYFDITARLGYAFDRALIYVKGGYANYQGGLSINDGSGIASQSELNGWTIGGGVEYQITPAWSVKAEYQRFDFTTTQLVINADGSAYNNDFTIDTFKVGLNYHFCSGYTPLK